MSKQAIINLETGELVEIAQRKFKEKGRNFVMQSQLSLEDISRDKSLNGTDLRVLSFILSKIDYTNIACVSQAFICERMDVQHSLVSQSIKKLIERGYISKVNVHGHGGYMVNPDYAIKGRDKKSQLQETKK